MQLFVERYGALVWSLARRLCPDVSEAEDAVQETFISLWESAGRFDPEVAAEATFVTMIARRRLIDRRRRRDKHRRVESLEDQLTEPSEEPDLDVAPEARVAEQALAQLRPEQQRVLRLSIYHGLTHREIAEQTGMPLGSVKTHARRGLIRVRDILLVRRPDPPPARPPPDHDEPLHDDQEPSR